MEHVTCKKCLSEFDLKPVEAPGQIPHKIVCEVCGSVLRDWDNDRHIILVMTKRGLNPDIIA